MSKQPLTAKYGLKVQDPTDTTKGALFDTSGIATGTTRTLKVQDTDAVLASVQDIQNNAADKPSMLIPAGVAATISRAHDPIVELGNSDLMIMATIIPTSLSSVLNEIIGKENGARAYFLQLTAAGLPQLFLRDLSGNQQTVTGTVPVTLGKPVTITGVRDSAGSRIYVNGVLQASNTTDPRRDVTTVSGDLFIGDTAANEHFNGQIIRTMILNRVPSDAVRNYYEAGGRLLAEDVGGSMVPIYGPQAFTGTLDSWTAYGAGVSVANTGGTVMTISGMRTSVTDCGVYRALAVPSANGKRLRVIVTLSCASGTRQIALGGLGTSNAARSNYHAITITTTPTEYYYDFDGYYVGSEVDIVPKDDINVDVIVDNISFIPLGALVAYEPETINAQTWPDSSGNLLHGTVSGAVAQNVNYRGGHVPVSASDTVPAGCVGEPKYFTATVSIAGAANDEQVVSGTLQAGSWMIFNRINFPLGTITGIVRTIARPKISGVDTQLIQYPNPPTVSSDLDMVCEPIFVTKETIFSVGLNIRIDSNAGGSSSITGHIRAVRLS
jgi:hypothetical protein